MNDTISMLLAKITGLAVKSQQPLIILENPRFAAEKAGSPRDPMKWTDPLIVTIGSAACTFGEYSASDLTEVYASLRSQLERNEVVEQNQSGAV